MDTLPFYIFLFIHLVSLITAFGSVLVTDFFGMLWLAKKIPASLVIQTGNYTEKLIWLGWGGLVLSGLGLITIKGYIDNLTAIKLFFVLMIAANGIFLNAIKKAFERVGDGPMPAILKFRIGLGSAISQLGWWGAFSIGFVHRHWRHTIDWPANPFLYMGLIAAAIIVVALAGTILLDKKPAK